MQLLALELCPAVCVSVCEFPLPPTPFVLRSPEGLIFLAFGPWVSTTPSFLSTETLSRRRRKKKVGKSLLIFQE